MTRRLLHAFVPLLICVVAAAALVAVYVWWGVL